MAPMEEADAASEHSRSTTSVGRRPRNARSRPQPRLSGLRGQALDEEIRHLREGLEGTRRSRLRLEAKLSDCVERQADWEVRKAATAEADVARHAAACKLQRVARGFLIRSFLRKTVATCHSTYLLQRTRVAMTESLLELGRQLHELKFLDTDRQGAATRLQAWWRAVLARRFCELARLHKRVRSRQHFMEAAAVWIQTCQRGRAARHFFRRYLEERERQRIQEETAAALYLEHCAVRIQSQVRRCAARAEAEQRRRMLWKELEGVLEQEAAIKEAPPPAPRRRSSGALSATGAAKAAPDAPRKKAASGA